jgi:hypothetical protein
MEPTVDQAAHELLDALRSTDVADAIRALDVLATVLPPSTLATVLRRASSLYRSEIVPAVLPPDERRPTGPVHVENLLVRVQGLQTAVSRALETRRYGGINEAQAAFRRWCGEVGLPLDFTDRTDPNQ